MSKKEFVYAGLRWTVKFKVQKGCAGCAGCAFQYDLYEDSSALCRAAPPCLGGIFKVKRVLPVGGANAED